MDSIFIYAIKISIPIGVFVLLYWFFLKDEKLFLLNRLFLLLGLVSGFAFPLIQLYFAETTPLIKLSYQLLPVTIVGEMDSDSAHGTYSAIKILSTIYILGTIVFAARFLFRLGQILFLILRHRGEKIDGFQAVYVKGNQSPYTFFNILFLPANSSANKPGVVVLEHERVHAVQLHTLDNLLVEVALVFQWFNPAVWLCKRFIGSVHEYAADKTVLEKGFNKFEYQKLMVETSTGMKVAGMSSHFNATLLKKRIVMMKNYRSNKLSVLKYTLVFPLFVLGLLILSPGSVSKAQTEPTEEVFMVVEKMPEYPGGLVELRNSIAQNLTYPESARKSGLEARLYVQFVVDEVGKVTEIEVVRSSVVDDSNEVVVVGKKEKEEGVSKEVALQDLEKEAVRVISLIEDFTPGEQRGKNVKVQFTIPINFALD